MSDGRGPQGFQPYVLRGSPVATGPAQQLRQAMALQQQGRLGDAERLCREVLKEAPGNADALHFLGLLEAQQGRYAPALALFDRAIAANPNNGGALFNRGNALRALGRLEDALTSYDRALALKPDHPAAQASRGAILYRLGRYNEALASFDRLLAANPRHADTLVNRGNALNELKRHEEALASYERALAAQPGHAAALYGRGNAEAALKRFAEAVTSYNGALKTAPGNVDVLNNRGIALTQLGKLEEAIADLCQAIAAAPDRPEAYVHRGNALLQRQHCTDALADYDRAIALRADYAEAFYGRGRALLELKRYEEAAEALEGLLRLRPDYAFAAGMLLHAKRSVCDWRGEESLVADILGGIRAGRAVATPLVLLAVSDSPAENAACARILAKNSNLKTTKPLWHGERYTHDRIRVAHVSSDFHTHAVALLMAGVFEHHDRKRFETIAVSFGPDDGSPMRKRLQRGFDRFIDVREKSESEIAALVRGLEADIAIDLKGFTGDARPGIFAARPAPVQVNYLGFPGTMGVDCYDYILADRTIIPEEQKPFYDERVAYLPHSYLPHDSLRKIGERTLTREACGLPKTGFVFCCFNAGYKIGLATFDIWMRLLGNVEGSVLWLSAAAPGAVRYLRREVEARGIAGGRLVFAAFTPTNEEHLARLANADLFLDTSPYNAHTTASDALFAGLPVLTCLGGSFAGRVGASLLKAAEIPELIAGTHDEYEALALALARDPARLAAIKAKLARNRMTAPLFDTARFTRDLEAAYTRMWERSQRGDPPTAFALEPAPAGAP